MYPLNRAVLVAFCMLLSSVAYSSNSPADFFSEQWVLVPDQSFLKFQSVKEKNGPKPEFSEFAFFEGAVDSSGVVNVTVQLDSIDTKIDLRNVRMRFLLFETFQHPTASVTASLDNQLVTDLMAEKRIRRSLDFSLELHGMTKTINADVLLTMVGEDRVAVATASPVMIGLENFGLIAGLEKLQEAAQVKILPSAAVHFDFVFKSGKHGSSVLAAARSGESKPATGALETAGEFSREECVGRFDILSRTGAIYFKSGSASLSAESVPLLATLNDIVERCPSLAIVVEGHTDSYGADNINLALSIARANSVVSYLIGKGIAPDRVRGIGYGETRPVVGNETAKNRSRNRRIEFRVAGS